MSETEFKMTFVMEENIVSSVYRVVARVARMRGETTDIRRTDFRPFNKKSISTT